MSVSRHLVDPQLLPALDLIPPIAFSLAALPEIRRQMAAFSQQRSVPQVDGVTSRDTVVPTAQGHGVRVLIHRPDSWAGTGPAVVYAHGGGFLLGSADAMRTSNQLMARNIACMVISVDYRLPPEVPHPGPVEDCYAVLKWVHDNAAELGVDRSRIAVAGESAGGGLAAATALLARDRGEVAVVHQHLIYPMLDDRTSPSTANPFTGEFVWSAESNQLGWSALRGPAVGCEDPCGYAVPARAESLAGLPSTFISVGALDLFAEEDMDYARRLMRAGVATELHLYPGAYHGFELAADAHVTRMAHHVSVAALKRALIP